MIDETHLRPTGNGTEQRISGAAPAKNRTLATAPSGCNGDNEFWVSEPGPMEDHAGEWDFGLYLNKDIWLATFTSLKARQCLAANV